MNQLVNSITVILTAVIGVAILSVILSKNSQTVGVIKAGSDGFSSILGAAEAPVTGSNMSGGFQNYNTYGQ
jgi:hypothetical protein